MLEEVHGQRAKDGEIAIAREDLEGMDLAEGAEVVAYQPGAESNAVRVKLVAQKKLPRRVALISEADRARLGLKTAPRGLSTMPVEVPRLGAAERVTLEDTTRPAPGADAFRWFFFASSPPWSNTRHSLSNVRLLQKDDEAVPVPPVWNGDVLGEGDR